MRTKPIWGLAPRSRNRHHGRRFAKCALLDSSSALNELELLNKNASNLRLPTSGGVARAIHGTLQSSHFVVPGAVELGKKLDGDAHPDKADKGRSLDNDERKVQRTY